MEFSRQEYWSGLSFPSPGDLPDPGIKPRSPALQADSLPSEPLPPVRKHPTVTQQRSAHRCPTVRLCWASSEPLSMTQLSHMLLKKREKARSLVWGQWWDRLCQCWHMDSTQFNSVTQSCPTLCDPMNQSTPGLPVQHQLLEFIQTHAHRVSVIKVHLHDKINCPWTYRPGAKSVTGSSGLCFHKVANIRKREKSVGG